MNRTRAHREYLSALYELETGRRRRGWGESLLLVGMYFAVAVVVLAWLIGVWVTGTFVGAAIGRLVQHGGGLS